MLAFCIITTGNISCTYKLGLLNIMSCQSHYALSKLAVVANTYEAQI